MAREIGDVLLDAPTLARRVRDLGGELAETYRGREPLLLAIMKGCVLFLADLVRAWDGPLDIDFVTAKSYRGTKADAIRLSVPVDIGGRVAGRPILVVDDIYDTGATLDAVCKAVERLGAEEVRTVVLLRKRRPEAARPREPDWVGFDIDDRFVVGYGLDHDGRFRNLPYVATLRPERGACGDPPPDSGM